MLTVGSPSIVRRCRSDGAVGRLLRHYFATNRAIWRQPILEGVALARIACSRIGAAVILQLLFRNAGGEPTGDVSCFKATHGTG